MKIELKLRKKAYLFVSVIILIILLGSCSKEKADKNTITVNKGLYTTEISIDKSDSLPPEKNRVYTNDSEFFDTTGLLKKTQKKSDPIKETIEEEGKNYQLEFVDPNSKNDLTDLYYKDISEFITTTTSD